MMTLVKKEAGSKLGQSAQLLIDVDFQSCCLSEPTASFHQPVLEPFTHLLFLRFNEGYTAMYWDLPKA
jgi:hypothetical protein